MSKYICLLFISFLFTLTAGADEPAAQTVDPRTQRCTQLESFFRTNPAVTPEQLNTFMWWSELGFIESRPRRLSSPALYRRLSRAYQRGELSTSCAELFSSDSTKNARGPGRARLNARIAHDTPAGVLEGKTHSWGGPQSSDDDVKIDYCVEKNNCQLQEPVSEANSQGKEICSISQSLLTPATSVEEQSQCSCLREFQTMQCITFDAAGISETVKNAVLQTYGQSFLNSYAQLREDAIFYKNRFPVIKGRNLRNSSCDEFAGFEAKVRKECRGQSNIEARMQTVLNAFSNLHPGTAFSMFEQTNAQILRMPGENGIKRDFVDYNRQILTMRPELRAVERMIQDCLKGGEWVRERVNSQNGGPSPMPYEKMAQLLKRKAFEDPAAFISRYLDRQALGNSYQIFVDYLNNPANRDDSESANNLFQSRMFQLMTGHPGFDNLLSNESYARRVAARIPATDGGLREFLEGPNSGLLDEFNDQCEDLQENFAALVCANDRKILSQLSRADLQDAVSENAESESIDPQMVDRLRCQVTGNLEGKTDGIFKRFKNSSDDSDYFKRFMLLSPSSTMAVVSDNLTRNREGYTRLLREGMAGAGNSITPYVPVNDPVASALFSEHPEISGVRSPEQSVANQAESPRTNNASAPIAERNAEVTPNSSSTEINPSQSIAGPISSTIAPSFSQSFGDNESKRMLSDSLARGSNQETVNQLISNIDDGAATELARLREELAQSKQQQMDDFSDRSQQLTQKMRELEREQTRLQNLNDTLVRPSDSSTVNRGPASLPSSDSDVVNPSRNQVRSTVQGPAVPLQENANASTAGAALAPTNSGSASLGGAGRSVASVRAGGIVVAKYAPVASGGPVTVDLPTISAIDGNVPSEDVNRNIIRYLEQNALDLRTLIQIKESGVLFRYQVNEGGQLAEREILLSYVNLPVDVKKIIDQKIRSANATPNEINRISSDIRLRRRNYSYETLRAIIVNSANGTLR